MKLIFKVQLALSICLALVLMGLKVEQIPGTTDIANESCPVMASDGPQSTRTEGAVLTYGPASSLIQIGDYLRRRWSRFTGPPADEGGCGWLPPIPTRF